MNYPYPTTLDDAVQLLQLDQMSDTVTAAAAYLQGQAYQVCLGLTKEYLEDIMVMSQQPSLLEYTPNDAGKRFASQTAAEQWLSKGKAVFLLFKFDDAGDRRLAGYGWAGASTSPYVPTGQTTFALRVGEADQGHGLAAPFAQIIIGAANALYEAHNFWLETWASNGGAVHIYHKIGFVDVAQEQADRPTRDGKTVPDERLYMSLPPDFLSVRL